jgi:hypothetical protein
MSGLPSVPFGVVAAMFPDESIARGVRAVFSTASQPQNRPARMPRVQETNEIPLQLMKSTPLTEAVASVARIFGSSDFPGRSLQGEGWNALIVLGMHRSGTSAMSGALAQLGVNFGDRLYRPQKDVNEKGFFEHGLIVDLHDKLLQYLGSSWDDPRPLSEDIFLDDSALAPFRHRLTKMVQRDFAGSAIWGLKDPRISRLLPLWKMIFSELGIQSQYIIMVRSPLEVAASLFRRDGFSAEKSVFLWWQHMIESEAKTRNDRRVFVNYSDLLRDPSGCLRQLQAALQVDLPRTVESAKPDLDSFLVSSLRHHEGANIPMMPTCAPESWMPLMSINVRARQMMIFRLMISRIRRLAFIDITRP